MEKELWKSYRKKNCISSPGGHGEFWNQEISSCILSLGPSAKQIKAFSLTWRKWVEARNILIWQQEQAGKGLLVAIGTKSYKTWLLGLYGSVARWPHLEEVSWWRTVANCFLMWNLQPGLTQSSFAPHGSDYIPASFFTLGFDTAIFQAAIFISFHFRYFQCSCVYFVHEWRHIQ